MIHPQDKLKVVHRNTDMHRHPDPILTSGLQEVCHDLRDIAILIEKQLESGPEALPENPFQSHIKA